MAYNLIITEHADALIDKLVGYLYRKLHHPEAALLHIDIVDDSCESLRDSKIR